MSWRYPHNYRLYRITTLNIPAVPKLSMYERHSVQFVWHLQAFYSTFLRYQRIVLFLSITRISFVTTPDLQKNKVIH